jgi:hypothetical protein
MITAEQEDASSKVDNSNAVWTVRPRNSPFQTYTKLNQSQMSRMLTARCSYENDETQTLPFSMLSLAAFTLQIRFEYL